MNQNTEYECFTREIYQLLVNADVVKATQVFHDVKIEGRSGQKHQIDVYWEYEIAGNKHKVAIECKNYNRPVPISVVQSFKGVLDDLNGVNGIIVTKKGFQEGAKRYAKEWEISLKELRTPGYGESIIGEIKYNTHLEVRHTLYKVDEEWAINHGIDFSRYRRNLNLMRFENDNKLRQATYVPLQTTDRIIRDSAGKVLNSLEKMESDIQEHPAEDFPITFYFEDGYVNMPNVGPVKILEVRFEYEISDQQRVMKIDAEGFVRAIIKDAQTGSTTLL